MDGIERHAPVGDEVVAYDRRNLALYAALLDSDEAGADWREVAATLMQLDPHDDNSERCWRSHLERARWIVGKGLAAAVLSFEEPQDPR